MNIADKTLNYVKSITAQSISKAGSGHSGTSLGASAIMLALFKDHYNFDVSEIDYMRVHFITRFCLCSVLTFHFKTSKI